MIAPDTWDAWFDASDLVEFESDLPRFHCPDFDGPEQEDPIPLTRRAARPPVVPGLVLVAGDEPAQDTAPWLPTWTILGMSCLPVGARWERPS